MIHQPKVQFTKPCLHEWRKRKDNNEQDGTDQKDDKRDGY